MARTPRSGTRRRSFRRAITSTRASTPISRSSTRRRKSSSGRRGSSPATSRSSPNAFDYRLFTHPAGVPLIIVRGDDQKVRGFYNICPHRGNTILYDPAGNAKRMTCIFHQWSYDTRGNCVEISRGEQGYQDRFCKEDAALREVRCEVAFGGFVWVNLDDAPAAARVHRRCAGHPRALHVEPMEVFHLPQGDRATPTTSCGTTPTASSITTSCTTLIASPA